MKNERDTTGILERFGRQVFNDQSMREYMPKDVYESLKETINSETALPPELSEPVADSMMRWAIEKGATHYTHWFQPMTNITAGKHDAFLSVTKDGDAVLEFSGKTLTMGEPDASSFPSGGLRATFEARGYTAWDPSSPAFIRDKTLYIPTAFCSYTGEALDQKTPLLRSMQAVDHEAIRVLRHFGNTHSKRVIPTVGAEQEYFLIDREKYEKRLDLKICGRTLFGAKPPKGQEMDDHYCGRIRIRVSEFMEKLDEQLWDLGVTAKTKHNEAAPAQHELAPVFCSANIACDHNQLVMETMRRVAKERGLACLLHEKPFDGVNGSGKHNNWSLSTDDGQNLFDPGKNAGQNLQFLTFLSAFIQAVDEYGGLLRLSSATAGNDRRLGGNEAPPAIISIFLGEALTDTLLDVAAGGDCGACAESILDTGVTIIPNLKRDDSDRNRTSPLAFTGNKFEFRMVGSSDSIAFATYVLNTIMADSLQKIADELDGCDDAQAQAMCIIRKILEDHGKIIFNGNNYANEWVEEAKLRGLPNLSNTVDAIETVLTDVRTVDLFERFGVFSKAEVEARHEVLLENYIKTISIESATMLEVGRRQILPACMRYAGLLSDRYLSLKQAGVENASMKRMIDRISSCVEEILACLESLEAKAGALEQQDTMPERAYYQLNVVIPAMNELRVSCDCAETIVPVDSWPMPSYTDLLHRV